LITPALLVAAVGCTSDRAELYGPHIAAACEHFEINTPGRLAAFLAQVGHESGSFRYAREIWGPTPVQRRYEGRADLGNTQPGDGERFKGHGLIQVTGRFNHADMRDRLRRRGVNCPDFEVVPEALALPEWAAWSAACFWDSRSLNALADAGEFEKITRRINGGLNGQEDRLQRWERAKAALPAPIPKEIPVVAPIVALAAAPFLEAAAGALATAIPRLGALFGGESPVAQRNVKAATIAVSLAKDVLGAKNEQEVVERVQADPAAAASVAAAVEANWAQLHEASEKSIDAARAHAMSYSQSQDVRVVMGRLTFIEVLTLILVAGGLFGGLGVLLWADVGPELKGAIITLILIESVVGVRKFWFGNPAGDPKKNG
jgi:putative chitinase